MHVRRHADRARLVRDRPLAGLADPPGRVGGELVAAPPVELLDRAVQPDHALLDEIWQGHAVPLVALRDRDDEAQVRIDHPLLRRLVSALDTLRERDLLGRREQLVVPGAAHEERQRVCGSERADGRVEGNLRRRLLRRLDFHVARIELGANRGDLLIAEVVLDRERLEGALLERPPLLGLVDERGDRCVQNRAQGFPLFLHWSRWRRAKLPPYRHRLKRREGAAHSCK